MLTRAGVFVVLVLALASAGSSSAGGLEFLHDIGDRLQLLRTQDGLSRVFPELLDNDHGEAAMRMATLIRNALVSKGNAVATESPTLPPYINITKDCPPLPQLPATSVADLRPNSADDTFAGDLSGISHDCLASTLQLITDYVCSPRERYAMAMADAAGKIESMVFSLNVRFFGSFFSCRDETDIPVTIDTSQSLTFDGQYCLLSVYFHYSSTLSIPFQISTCLPSTCSTEEVLNISSVAVALLRQFILVKEFDVTSAYCDYNPELSAGAIVMICIIGVLVLLVVCGSIADYCIRRKHAGLEEEEDQEHVTSDVTGVFTQRNSQVNLAQAEQVIRDENGDDDDTPTVENIPSSSDVDRYQSDVGLSTERKTIGESVYSTEQAKRWSPLLAFSVYLNGPEVLSTKSEHSAPWLNSVYGMRVLSIMWVMYGMNYQVSITVSLNPGDYSTGSFIGQTVSDPSMATDTFLIISGLLVTYWGMKHLKENGKFNWLLFYFHKFWRLFPLYYFVLFYFMYCLVYTCLGPTKYLLDKQLDVCYENWWTVVLFVQNLYPYHDGMRFRCLGWSWYVSLLVQYLIITPIILVILHWRKVWGFVTIGALFLVDFVCTILIVGYWGLPVDSSMEPFNNRSDYKQLGDYIDTKPQTRLASYLVGMCLGYLIVNEVYKQKRLNKWLVALLWILSIIIGIWMVYAKYWALNGPEWGLGLTIVYYAFSRFFYSLCVAWCLFACIHGYGGFVNRFLSWKFFIPLGRLVYCLFLIHPVLMIKTLVGSEVQLYVYDLNFAYLYVPHLMFGFFLSFWLVLLIERPFMKLERLMYRRGLKNTVSS